jgi:hypothetical protein
MALTLRVKGDAKDAIKALKDVGIEAKETGKKTKKSGKTITSSMVKGTLAFVGITTAANLFRSALDRVANIAISSTTAIGELGNTIAKQGRMVGITAEQYQGLEFAAERSGVSITAIAHGLKKLGRVMLDAQNGSRQIKETFAALDITLKKQDGTLRDSFDVFSDLSDRFASMGPSAERTGASMLLLGRAGTEMANLMANGSEGLAEYLEVAKDLGAVMGTDLLNVSELYHDSTVDLEFAIRGAKLEIANEFLPVIIATKLQLREMVAAGDWSEWSGGLSKAVMASVGLFVFWGEMFGKVIGAFIEGGSQFIGMIKDVAALVGLEIGKIEDLERVLGQTAELYNLEGLFDFGAAYDRLARLGDRTLGVSAATDKAAASQKTLSDELKALGDAYKKALGMLEENRKKTGGATNALDRQVAALDRLIKKWRQAYESMQQGIRGLKEEIELFGKEGIDLLLTEQMFDKERVKAEFDELQKMLVEQATFITNSKVFDAEERERRLGEIGERARKAHLARTEQDLLIETLTSKKIEQLRAEELEKEKEDNAARIEMLADYKQQQVDNAVAIMGAISDVAAGMAEAISAVYGEESQEAKKAAHVVFAITQGLALASAIVTTAQSVSAALANPPGVPYTIPQGVAAGVLGGAQIATIAATTIAGIAGMADAGLPPGALRAAGLNNHTVLAVGKDEMVLDPVGTRAISQMLQQQIGGRGANDPVVVNTTLEIDGHVLGQTVDNHLIRSQERGLGYQRRVGYGMAK